MNTEDLNLLSDLVNKGYLKQAAESRDSYRRLYRALFANRRIPDTPWPALAIRGLLNEFSLMDSNNFLENVGVGEREGRSGELVAEQPKAVGSSILVKLVHYLVADCLQNVCHIKSATDPVIVPAATGMSLTLCFLALKRERPLAKFVIWSRIDQKSCIKAMTAVGLTPIPVAQKLVADGGLEPDSAALIAAMCRFPVDEILCVFLTTSCFAPRSPDDVPTISRECKRMNLPLVVNNAYGLQCGKCCHLVEAGFREGRIDAVVQSTDKNFQVPVGGSIIIGRLSAHVSKLYPGRASASPLLDLLITFLEVGRQGLVGMFAKRKEVVKWFMPLLEVRMKEVQLRVIPVPKNGISFAIELNGSSAIDECLSSIGSALFLRRVSGPRVVDSSKKDIKVIDDLELVNFGAHQPDFHKSYLTVAVAVGVTQADLITFLDRFCKIIL